MKPPIKLRVSILYSAVPTGPLVVKIIFTSFCKLGSTQVEPSSVILPDIVAVLLTDKSWNGPGGVFLCGKIFCRGLVKPLIASL